ncbi:hypothetical protein PGB90_006078 [Kerria lacca]
MRYIFSNATAFCVMFVLHNVTSLIIFINQALLKNRSAYSYAHVTFFFFFFYKLAIEREKHPRLQISSNTALVTEGRCPSRKFDHTWMFPLSMANFLQLPAHLAGPKSQTGSVARLVPRGGGAASRKLEFYGVGCLELPFSITSGLYTISVVLTVSCFRCTRNLRFLELLKIFFFSHSFSALRKSIYR